MITIVAFALPVLTIGFFIWFFVRMRRPRKSKTPKEDPSTRQERAVWAWAKILSSSQGALNTFRMARVEMMLEVHMPGSPAYQAKAIWLVEQEALASVEEGKEIALKVDPQGPQYVFPNGTWAKSLE
jgi:heme/copper-type cytochrome/quinol oxidase subunit 2